MTDFSQFRAVLEQTGYIQNYVTFGDGNLRAWDWERSRRLLEGKPKLLWEALLCGKEVSRAALEKAVGKATVGTFLERGLCSAKKGKISFGAHCLVYSNGVLFFVNRNSLEEGYFGEDSRTVMSLGLPGLEGQALCLYSGTGAEVLAAAAGGNVQLTVEAPECCHPLIQTNLELNRASSPKVRDGSETGRGGEWNTIVARVPGFLELPNAKLPSLIAGGPNGNGRWPEFFGRVQQGLASDGRAIFAGTYFCGKEPGRAAREFEALLAAHQLNASVNISSKIALEFGIPIFNQTVAFAERASGLSRDELTKLYEAKFEELGQTHVYMVKGIAWKARKSAPGSILDLSEQYYGTWFS
jgi:hypothetical protein